MKGLLKIINLKQFLFKELDKELLNQYNVIYTKDGVYFKNGIEGDLNLSLLEIL